MTLRVWLLKVRPWMKVLWRGRWVVTDHNACWGYCTRTLYSVQAVVWKWWLVEGRLCNCCLAVGWCLCSVLTRVEEYVLYRRWCAGSPRYVSCVTLGGLVVPLTGTGYVQAVFAVAEVGLSSSVGEAPRLARCCPGLSLR